MSSFKPLLAVILIFLSVNSCTPPKEVPTQTILGTISTTPTRIASSPRTCTPTFDDGVSPSYKPDTPERTVVGSGHVVTGVVLSSLDCQPIANAKLEFWPEEEGLGHPDSSRATFFTDERGR